MGASPAANAPVGGPRGHGQAWRDRLLPHAGLRLGNMKTQGVEVHLVEPGFQDFAVAHRGIETKQDEKPTVGVLIPN